MENCSLLSLALLGLSAYLKMWMCAVDTGKKKSIMATSHVVVCYLL